MLAPTFSHNAEMLLIEEIRYAKNELATILHNSLENIFVVMILSAGTQFKYILDNISIAF